MSALLALLLLHEGGVSSSRIEVRGPEVRVDFTFSLEDLASLARLDADRNGIVDEKEWAAALPGIADYVGRAFQVLNGDEQCSPAADGDLPPALPLSESRAPVTVRLRYRSGRRLDRLTIRCTLLREHGGNPRHVAETGDGRTLVFDRDRSEAELRVAGSGGRWGWGAGTLGLALAAAAFRKARAAAAAA